MDESLFSFLNDVKFYSEFYIEFLESAAQKNYLKL